MFRPHTALLVAVVCAFAGCASTPRDPLVARQKAYERLASFLEPGMTRRQLYALLPPQRPPMTTIREPFRTPYTMLGRDAFQPETYPLDPDFDLNTEFILASSPYSKIHSFPAPFSFSGATRSGALAISAHAIDVHYSASSPIERSQGRVSTGARVGMSISANKIDELLFGKVSPPKRSKQNMDDRIYARPRVVRH